MTSQNIMARLEELYVRRDRAKQGYELEVYEVIPASIRAQLAELDNKHDAEMEEINEAIKAAEEQVKAAVIETGETIKGTRYQAIWSKPRMSWDDKRLEEYFRANDPDALERMRKVGAPSVSIRTLKG
jgi:LPS O-antigen subunit length determinant protein (WzzB/FepE family)